MGSKTEIGWTDSTWSPIRARVKADAAQIAKAKGYTSLVQIAGKMAGHVGPHCEHVSDGCTNCYSGAMNHRCLPANGTGLPFDRRSRDLLDTFVDEKILMQPLRWRTPRKIFVMNQSDLFGEWVLDGQIVQVWLAMARAPWHTYQILTKHAQRMCEFMRMWADVANDPILLARGPRAIREFHSCGRAMLFASFVESLGTKRFGAAYPAYDWDEGPRWWPTEPLSNIWLGVSAENQETFDERVLWLRQTPAAIRFLSLEPLLRPIEVRGRLEGISLAIIGGESGHGARPMNPAWARSIRDQCAASGVSYFHKQNGEFVALGSADEADNFPRSKVQEFDDGMRVVRIGKKAAGCLLDGREWKEFPKERL